MKQIFGNRSTFLSMSAVGVLLLLAALVNLHEDKKGVQSCGNPSLNHSCVMKTIFGLNTKEETGLISTFTTESLTDAAVKKGLAWIEKAQTNDGGWGAGTHARQDILDPHAVPSDPATTALVAMALLRTENTLQKGEYSADLKKANEFLMNQVEQCPDNQIYLTTLTNTQPQIKLGRNIDVILTAQFFTNLLRYDITDAELKKRVEKCLDKCVTRIQKEQ